MLQEDQNHSRVDFSQPQGHVRMVHDWVVRIYLLKSGAHVSVQKQKGTCCINPMKKEAHCEIAVAH